MIWKHVCEAGDWPYQVSDTGLVRRIGGHVLSPMWMGKKRKQYAVVSLCKGGKELRRKVHILVLEAFHGPRPAGMLGLHEDDDTRNNAARNLYWGTHSRNADDARHTGSVLSPQQVLDIRARRLTGEGGRKLAGIYGVSEQFICDIHKRRCYDY